MNLPGLDILRSNHPVAWAGRVVVAIAGVWFVLTISTGAELLPLTTWGAYVLLALSLVLVWGKGEIFSFAQAAFFGLGAYAYGAASLNFVDSTQETLSAVAIGAGVGAVVSAGVGYFIFYGNLKALPVAVVTLASSLVLFTVFSSFSDPKYHIGRAVLGGYNGMSVPPLAAPGSPAGLSPQSLFMVVGIAAVLVAFLVRLLMAQPFGRILVATAVNDERSELLGYDPRRARLLTFALGGAIAALGGALYAGTSLYIDPSVFGLAQAALVVVWVMVGGRTSLIGAFVGVYLIQKLNEQLGGSGGDYGPLVLGVVLILVVVALPGGLVPACFDLVRRVVRTKPIDPESAKAAAMHGALPIDLHTGNANALVVSGLTKRFGGLLANSDVNITFAPSDIHAIVGPNGAGKSTLFAMLVGIYRPTSGSIRFGATDITRSSTFKRARMGFGIKRQVPSVYPALTVHENLWIASYADTRQAMAARERTDLLLDWLGMKRTADRPASELSHGHRQLLEITMVLAARPTVILLDEPTAGMTAAETAQVATIIHAVANHCTVIVVEHDMEFIRAMRSPITVMHRGSVLTSGSIDEIRADERVLNVYLGRDHAAAS